MNTIKTKDRKNMTFVFLKEWDIVTRASGGWGSKVKENVSREITQAFAKSQEVNYNCRIFLKY